MEGAGRHCESLLRERKRRSGWSGFGTNTWRRHAACSSTISRRVAALRMHGVV